jgi:hypothetical protein
MCPPFFLLLTYASTGWRSSDGTEQFLERGIKKRIIFKQNAGRFATNDSSESESRVSGGLLQVDLNTMLWLGQCEMSLIVASCYDVERLFLQPRRVPSPSVDSV